MPSTSPIAVLQISRLSGFARAAAIMLCAVLAVQPPRAIAADQEQKRAAMNDLAREMTTCTAFFTLASSVLKSTTPPGDEPSMTARYTAAGKMMFEQATELAKALGLEDEVLEDWSGLALQQMVKEINDDPKNSTALMTTKYDEPCKRLLTDPQARLRELLER